MEKKKKTHVQECKETWSMFLIKILLRYLRIIYPAFNLAEEKKKKYHEKKKGIEKKTHQKSTSFWF